MNNSNKNFGIVFSSFFLIVFIYFFYFKNEIKIIFVSFSIIFLILGIFNSRLLTPLNKTWTKIGEILGKLVTPLVLFLIFYFIFTPLGLIIRLMQKKLLVEYDINKKSYWIKSEKVNSMRLPF